MPRGNDEERGKKRGVPSLGNPSEALEAAGEGLEKRMSKVEVEVALWR